MNAVAGPGSPAPARHPPRGALRLRRLRPCPDPGWRAVTRRADTWDRAGACRCALPVARRPASRRRDRGTAVTGLRHARARTGGPGRAPPRGARLHHAGWPAAARGAGRTAAREPERAHPSRQDAGPLRW